MAAALVGCFLFGVTTVAEWAVWFFAAHLIVAAIAAWLILRLGRPRYEIVREEIRIGALFSTQFIFKAVRQNTDILVLGLFTSRRDRRVLRRGASRARQLVSVDRSAQPADLSGVGRGPDVGLPQCLRPRPQGDGGRRRHRDRGRRRRLPARPADADPVRRRVPLDGRLHPDPVLGRDPRPPSVRWRSNPSAPRAVRTCAP